MSLDQYVNTYGQYLLRRYGERVHKLALNAGLTCPNRDGSKGRGGCTFCNNASFTPGTRQAPSIAEQLEAGRCVLAKRTGAKRFVAYFQAYTNTYDETQRLANLYQQALSQVNVVGLSVGTRPDCVNDAVLDLLCDYQDQGYEVWLELGLQSAFDESLRRVNRGHDFRDYIFTLTKARKRRLRVCTHLIVGLPGEIRWHANESLMRVLDLGVDGLKLHPLHVVKGTQLANQWRRSDYQPMSMETYVRIAADLITQCPAELVFHRLTATASANILLAPLWCNKKWKVLNAIESELRQRVHPLPHLAKTAIH